MNDRDLRWNIERTREVLKTPIFTLNLQTEKAAVGIDGDYYAFEAPEWIVVLPVIDDNFVMVRQWRHAMQGITTEFPGGIGDPGEDPLRTATRELLEETGYRAGKMTHIGTCNPNPALFHNQIHFYLAEDLTDTGSRHLDADEVLTGTLVPIRDAIAHFASDEYQNAFMGVALMLYNRHIGKL
ncbi:MAG: NUDIX hydrolase [Lachnospiraceae bacterium]|nr:NUDIX hydrolase [Lachnospiraceae bacterium]